ncbi:MAG: nitrous oxide reductase accessory protein NosL [Sulfuricella sp.]|nr:nitrous oxide reductase accessory protein NosL [Sulfuricella sp.]
MACTAAWGAIAAAGGLPPAASKELRCPVCGMIPASYPKWRTQIIFRDGTVTALDSPAEMLRFLGNMAKYDSKHTSADIAEIQATDFIRKSLVDARRASYVSGSSARGPMGPDLPAFENKADAEFFARTAGGRTLNFDQAAKETGSASAR